MLLKLPVQGILGMSAPVQNAGSVENTGFDLNIFHNNRINKDFSYAVNLNLAYVKNRITNLEGTEGEDQTAHKDRHRQQDAGTRTDRQQREDCKHQGDNQLRD